MQIYYWINQGHINWRIEEISAQPYSSIDRL